MRRAAVWILLSALILVLSPDEIARVGQTPTPRPSVSFVAVGDVLLARGIERKIAENGRDWPLAEVADILKSADLTFGNLECPFSAKGIKVNKRIAFKADPANAKCLAGAGFDVISLANNHALDCSRPGLASTMDCLESNGIAYCGAADTLEDAALPTILKINGLKIAFLARNALFPEAVWLRPDAVNIAPLDNERVVDEIADAAKKADVVIVSLHWGVEYRKTPTEGQVELAHKMIDAGADLIIGHHPHVLQPIEEYHGGVIAYSLGNFLFDNSWPRCRDSAILRCRLSPDGVSDVEMIPVRNVGWRPVPVEPKTPAK